MLISSVEIVSRYQNQNSFESLPIAASAGSSISNNRKRKKHLAARAFIFTDFFSIRPPSDGPVVRHMFNRFIIFSGSEGSYNSMAVISLLERRCLCIDDVY